MSKLPNLNFSEHMIEQPSTKKKISIKPWTMKEQQPLYVALESGNIGDIFLAINNVVKACITTEDFDTSTLTTFDVEMLFIRIRGKSVGEIQEFSIKCNSCPEPHFVPVSINLQDVKIDSKNDLSSEIDLGGGIFVKMRYPTFASLIESGEAIKEQKVTSFDLALETVIKSIDVVKTPDVAMKADDFSYKELRDFVLSSNQEQMKKFLGFVNSYPTIHYDIDYVCDKCFTQQKKEIRGILDFFA